MSEPIQSISQNNYILATQQEVSHDNTLSGNGTVDSPLGLNETMLYENAEGTEAGNMPVTLSESIQNFERVVFYWQAWGDGTAKAHTITTCMTDITTYTLSTIYVNNGNLSNISVYAMVDILSSNGTSLSHIHGYFNDLKTNTVSQSSSGFRLYKVIGINRKAQ